MKREWGYMTAEAAFWVPAVSLLLMLLIYLCSYLYQGCFLTQAAYVAAFRGSRQETMQQRQFCAKEQLESLFQREVLCFGEERREVKAGPVWVQVTLSRETPLVGPDGEPLLLKAQERALYRDPVAYIRGIQFFGSAGEFVTAGAGDVEE